jgi:N-acetylglutamate synthase-like GNAT family acetyltransferase
VNPTDGSVSVEIRSAGSKDITAILNLVMGILQTEFPQAQAAYPADDIQHLLDVYRPPKNLFLVAEEDGCIVGTCGVKAEDTRTAILRRLFVAPSHRGRGIGLALLKKALDFCRDREFQEVVIRTSTAMEQAIRLCRSLGFCEDGKWHLGDTTLVRFRLRLSSE